MMKPRTKFISLLLAALMLLGAVSPGLWAAADETSPSPADQTAAEAVSDTRNPGEEDADQAGGYDAEQSIPAPGQPTPEPDTPAVTPDQPVHNEDSVLPDTPETPSTPEPETPKTPSDPDASGEPSGISIPSDGPEQPSGGAEQPSDPGKDVSRPESQGESPKPPFPHGDPSADVEISSEWEDALEDLDLTGRWHEDLLAVARTQVGYEASRDNFITDDQGVRRGYTRYGAWHKTPYAPWNTLFLRFCLEYAEIPEEAFPRDDDPEAWRQALIQGELYSTEKQPGPGDLVFLSDEEKPETASAVAVLEEVGEDGTLRVIAGDVDSEVKCLETPPAQVLGFGLLPRGEDAESRTSDTDPSAPPDRPGNPDPAGPTDSRPDQDKSPESPTDRDAPADPETPAPSPADRDGDASEKPGKESAGPAAKAEELAEELARKIQETLEELTPGPQENQEPPEELMPEPQEPPEELSPEPQEADFSRTAEADGVLVTVTAAPGVFPEDARLSVTKVPDVLLDAVDAVVEPQRDGSSVAASYTFDITILDADGSELQPADGGEARVTFALAEAADGSLDPRVYHIGGAGEDLSAQSLDVESDGETLSVTTGSFSIFKLEFTQAPTLTRPQRFDEPAGDYTFNNYTIHRGVNGLGFATDAPLSNILIDYEKMRDVTNAVPLILSKDNGFDVVDAKDLTLNNESSTDKGLYVVYDNTKENAVHGSFDKDTTTEWAGDIFSFTYPDAALLDDGSTADVVLTYSNLSIATQSNLRTQYSGQTYIASGDMIRAGNSIPSASSLNARYGMGVDINIQVRQKDGSLVHGTFFYCMSDIDVLRSDVASFRTLNGAETCNAYSEQVAVTGGVVDNTLYIPDFEGVDDPRRMDNPGNAGYKCAIEEYGENAVRFVAAGYSDRDGDSTAYSGFVAVADNTNGGISLRAWTSGSSQAAVRTSLFSVGVSGHGYHRIKSSTGPGGNIQTTELGNLSGRLDDGSDMIGPATIVVPDGKTVVYTMTPEFGYEITRVIIGDGIYGQEGTTTIYIERLKELKENPNQQELIALAEDRQGVLRYDEEKGTYTFTFPDNNYDHMIHVDWGTGDTLPNTGGPGLPVLIRLALGSMALTPVVSWIKRKWGVAG